MRKATDIPPQKVANLIRYCPETGLLYWRERTAEHFKAGTIGSAAHAKGWNSTNAGKLAFRNESFGYRIGHIFGMTVPAHKVAWCIHYGEWPKAHIDHINRDRADNRITNLRLATPTQNVANCRAKSTGASPYKGVSWHKANKKWIANIRINGKRKHLGYFESEECAAKAYDKAAREVFQEFAFLNFPRSP